MWDLIVSVPDHCLSFYFDRKYTCRTTNIETIYWTKHVREQVITMTEIF